MLLNINNVTKSFLDDVVLSNISLEINEGDRIGLLGVNGAGKTTLLNIIDGCLEPDDGQVVRRRGLNIGYLRQNDALDSTNSIAEEARDAFKETLRVKKQLDEAAAAMQNNPDDPALMQQYDRLAAKFEAMDGWHIDDKIARVLNGLNFKNFDKDMPVAALSGGEKTRFGIAKMLLCQPDVLILDEPTNHLDFSMLMWLEEYLRGYKGAVIVVSHDRYFLDAVAKDICEIEFNSLSRYKGSYSAFKTQKDERFKVAMRAWEKQQAEIADMEDYVRRNMARASTTGMAQSRQKILDKMQRLEKPRQATKSIYLKFNYNVEPFSTILSCKNLGAKVKGGRDLFGGISLEVQRGEKIAIVGLNGVGKSTFLKSLLAKTEYAQNIDDSGLEKTGAVQWGGNVRIGYFDQELAGLDPESTVIEAVHSRYKMKTEFEIRSLLGKMLIEGEAVYKKVKELSGANRAKVAFAILTLKRANVLVLDEPTNHLDYLAKDALEEALANFDGTLIAVSHDRYFLRRVPSRILEMTPEHFDIYNGNYDYYLEKKGTAQQNEAVQAAQKKQQEQSGQEAQPTAYRSKQQRAEQAQRRNRQNALEREIEELEEKIKEYNSALLAQENQSDFEKLEELSHALNTGNEKMAELLEEWEEVSMC